MTKWTPESEAALKRLVGEGHTAARIAEFLNEIPGASYFSRNGVIGKADRMGLQLCASNRNGGRPKGFRTEKQSAQDAGLRAKFTRQRLAKPLPPKKVAPSKPPAAAAAPPGANLTAFLDRRREQCWWPIWGDGPVPIEEKMVCGNPATVEGLCEYHDKVKTGKTA